MSNYVILTDSASDLPSELVKKYNIGVIPLVFYLDGKNYELTSEENEKCNKFIYTKLREGLLITTSQVNPSKFVDFFESYLKQGLDIIYIAFSSALSGTYQSSLIAKDELKDNYPNSRIEIIDSLAASLGQGLLVTNACDLKKEGSSYEEVLKYLNDYRLRIVHFFTVDDLNFLKRGGRLSASSAFVGTLLKLKPILHVSNEGKLVPIGKVSGRKNSLRQIAKRLTLKVVDWEHSKLFISHGDCIEDVNYFISCLKDENINPANIVIGNIGPVIGAHAGPGTVAVFFESDTRR